MFIAILSVKLKVKTYVQIHHMAIEYWDQIDAGLDLKPIRERQLRDRLKKSAITLESQQRLSFSCFLISSLDRVISADNMMNRVKSPQCHKKQKDKGIIPKNLRGIDK